MIVISCELELDGVAFPSTPADAAARRPVALAPLRIDWGRADGTEQPDATTATITVRVFDPPDDILAVAHVGTALDVYAAGDVPGAAVVDAVNAAPNPSLETGVLTGWATTSQAAYPMSVDASGVMSGIYSAMTTRTADTPTVYAGVIVVNNPAGPGGNYPVTPGVPVTAALDVKPERDDRRIRSWYQFYDAGGVATSSPILIHVPASTAGQLYRIDHTETPPPGTVAARLRVEVAATAGNAVAGERVWFDRLNWGGAGYFDGDTLPADGYRYAWTGAAKASPSTRSVTGTASRRVPVYSGTVTDLDWSAVDDDAVDLALVAVDVTGPLGNRPIGDPPWPAQTIATRAARIVTLANLPGLAVDVDDRVGAFTVTGRDVDNQPALDMLRDLAQSAGGVLWPMGAADLWLEDPATRAAIRVLVERDGVIVIDNPRNPSGDLAVVSACDLLRDPVRWAQARGDVVSTVDVTWLEQTLGGDGLLDPTERHQVATDPAAEAIYGVNRTSIGTELVTAADADALAATVLAATSTLAWRVSGVVYDTGLVADALPGVDPGQRIGSVLDLLDASRRPGLGVTLTDLPGYAPIAGATTAAYLEGGSYTYDVDAWQLELTLTPSPAGAGASATWADLHPGWTWAQLEPAITWADMAGTGVAP